MPIVWRLYFRRCLFTLQRMPTDHIQSLSEGITFQTSAPVDWCKVESLTVGITQSQTASANLRLLNALNVLEDVPQEFEKSPQHLSESIHLDAKLDLILGMLGELLHQQANIPETLRVTVSAHSLLLSEVKATALPAEGDLLRMRLFLNTRYPQPLVLYGSVSSTTVTGFSLVLCDLGELVQEQFDKLIFRQHRRAIASSRSESDT